MAAGEHPEGAASLHAAAGELVERDRADHEALRRARVEDGHAVLGEPPGELDVLLRRQILVEGAVLRQEGALARGPTAPEVVVVEHLPVLDVRVGEEQLPDLGHVLHHGRDLELRRPGRVPEDDNALVRVAAMRLQMRVEEPAVADVVVIEEEDDGRLRCEQPEALRRRDAGVLDREVTEGQFLCEALADARPSRRSSRHRPRRPRSRRAAASARSGSRARAGGAPTGYGWGSPR